MWKQLHFRDMPIKSCAHNHQQINLTFSTILFCARLLTLVYISEFIKLTSQSCHYYSTLHSFLRTSGHVGQEKKSLLDCTVGSRKAAVRSMREERNLPPHTHFTPPMNSPLLGFQVCTENKHILYCKPLCHLHTDPDHLVNSTSFTGWTHNNVLGFLPYELTWPFW